MKIYLLPNAFFFFLNLNLIVLFIDYIKFQKNYGSKDFKDLKK